MKDRCIAIIFLVYFSALITSCKNVPESKTYFSMGTVCTINLFDAGTKERYDECEKCLKNIEHKMTINRNNVLLNKVLSDDNEGMSELETASLYAGEKAVSVSEETFQVLKCALEYASLSDGAFNPAIGPLVKLWNINGDIPYVPSETEIQKTLLFCDWKKISLDENNKTLFLTQEKMIADLGGIAKGYAADCLVSLFDSWKISKALVSLGGNVYAYGDKDKKGTPWKIGIKNPVETDDSPVIRLDVNNTSVVTSGIYERFFEADGKKYHHILDSKTGRPVDNDIVSVSIICKKSMEADVLATTVLALGKEKGMDFLTKKTGAEGIIILKDRTILHTAGLTDKIIILDERFSLIQ